MAGRSSITAVRSIYYIVHVLLGVFVNILKYGDRPRKAAPRLAAMDRLLQCDDPAEPRADCDGADVRAAGAYPRGIFGGMVGSGGRWCSRCCRGSRIAAAGSQLVIGIDQPSGGAAAASSCACSWWCFYRFSLRISDLKDANIELSQKIAILEFKVHSLHEDRHS